MKTMGGSFDNAAWNLGQLKRSPGSWTLAALVLVLYGLVATMGGPDAVGHWYEVFGLSREGFFGGDVWQVVSYGLLHGSALHVGLNALFVLLIGSRIETMVGRAGLFRVALLGVLGGGIGHLLLGRGLLVGFSGACLAFLLLLTTLSPQSRMFPLPVSARSLGIGVLLAELALALMDPALGCPGFSLVGDGLVAMGAGAWFEMGHACHVGGGLAGGLFGRWVLRPRVGLARLKRDRARREAR